jgi:DnaJ-class molecular chaperone
MGLFNAISVWKQANDEKRISKMESQGTCPDCHGRGFSPLFSEFVDFTAYVDDCHSCNGSGLFSAWAETKQR